MYTHIYKLVRTNRKQSVKTTGEQHHMKVHLMAYANKACPSALSHLSLPCYINSSDKCSVLSAVQVFMGKLEEHKKMGWDLIETIE